MPLAATLPLPGSTRRRSAARRQNGRDRRFARCQFRYSRRCCCNRPSRLNLDHAVADMGLRLVTFGCENLFRPRTAVGNLPNDFVGRFPWFLLTDFLIRRPAELAALPPGCEPGADVLERSVGVARSMVFMNGFLPYKAGVNLRNQKGQICGILTA